MKISAWRIVKRRYSRSAFSGEGARLFGGRWNYPGTALVYLAEWQSLAILEMLVHLDGSDLLQSYITIRAEFDEELVETKAIDHLPMNWRGEASVDLIREMGEEWAMSARTPVLKVPSVIVPSEANFLLNPGHPRFREVIIGQPEPFRFDVRLTRVEDKLS